MSLAVVLVDDAVVLRDGLRLMLETQGIRVAEVLASADGLLDVVTRERPDVAVLDLRMPPDFGLEGLAAARELRLAIPSLGLLLLSSYLEIEVASQLMGLGSGVGYLLKERVQDVEEFAESLAEIAAGGTVLDPEITELLLARPATRSILAGLTARELEVLALIAGGRSNVGIGRELFLQPKTVERYVSQVFTKLGLAEEPASNRRVLAVLTYLREARASQS